MTTNYVTNLAFSLAFLVIIVPFSRAAVPASGPTTSKEGGSGSVADPPVSAARSLQPDFYKKSCPNAETIIFNVMNKNKDKNGTLPGITRLLFHDCFITGCDASILLSTSPSNQTEIDFPANGVSIRGLDVIAEAKTELEKQCPGVVSCADLLAFAARDAAVINGNPKFPISGGRRDSLVSKAQDAMALPAPQWTMDQITSEFGKRNVSLEGVVALLGAHSIGRSRCFNTVANKEKLSAVKGADKVLNPEAKSYVEGKCPNLMEGNVAFDMANETGKWGVSYFGRTLEGKAVMPSDLGIVLDPKAKKIAESYVADPKLWAQKYNEALTTMGTWNVLIGDQGQVRKNCGFVNK